MTAATQGSKRGRSNRQFFASGFFLGLLAFSFVLLLLGGGGFLYLTANSPLALLSGGDRPIAAATTFIPAGSPFTVSLLTKPEKLVILQQAITGSDHRQQTQNEIDQLKQSLLESTGLDYDQDLQPWIGNELTFAFTDPDLDLDATNGQQPGYLLAVEIAIDKQQQAREFLQLFWQRQSLMGHPPQSEQTSGVRILYSDADSSSVLTAASALVGDEFIIFASDLRVLHRSIQVAQTAENLAQDRAYRQAAERLPESRIGLAYIDLAVLNEKRLARSFVAIGLAVTRAGMMADIQLADVAELDQSPLPFSAVSKESLKFLPADSALALASDDLSQLVPALTAIGLTSSGLPDFLQPDFFQNELGLWTWANGEYSIGQVSASGDDWILTVLRDDAGIAQLDEAVATKGYSAVPVTIGEEEAIAWTRFKTSLQRRSATSSLETEVLGLHLQQGEYEIFASTLPAMESALLAPQNSLVESARFTQAIASLPQPNSGYFYADWQAIAPLLSRTFPAFRRIESAARPLLSHVDTLAATREGSKANLLLRMRQRP